jgi:hypothetical protein
MLAIAGAVAVLCAWIGRAAAHCVDFGGAWPYGASSIATLRHADKIADVNRQCHRLLFSLSLPVKFSGKIEVSKWSPFIHMALPIR